jgi:hypothetical protein
VCSTIDVGQTQPISGLIEKRESCAVSAEQGKASATTRSARMDSFWRKWGKGFGFGNWLTLLHYRGARLLADEREL